MLTLIALRARVEGFDGTQIGLLGAAYYAGVLCACLVTARMILRAGHIRVFAALSALAAAATLTLALVVDAWLWILARGLAGFCFAGVSMVIESWLNELAGSGNRGRVLSAYRIVDLGAVTCAQFALPLVGIESFEIFALTAILFCLALIPVSLSRLSDPAAPESAKLRPGFIWAMSPVACVGALTIGLTNSSFRTLGPVYAQEMGLDVDRVALFMSLGILAGALFQYPLGWLSDRFDRRSVLILATAGAAAAGAALSAAGPDFIFVGVFLFGGFALPLYSLSVAHAADFAERGQYFELAAGLTLFYALGASLGPLASSQAMQALGAPAIFGYAAVLHGVFLGFVIYRMTRRAAPARALRKRFVALLRTSPQIANLSRPEGAD